MSQQSVLVMSILLLSFALLALKWFSRKKGDLPPGPTPLPIIGNAFQIDHYHPWETFTNWSKKYGSIIHVSTFGKSLIIINSPEIASELLDKKSQLSSGRPIFTMAELTGWGPLLPLLQNSDRFKKTRKLMRQALNPTALQIYSSMLEKGAAECVSRLMVAPDDLIPEIRRAIGVGITNIAYGFKVQQTKDPYIGLAEEALEIFGETTRPTAWIVDIFPILKYLPIWFPGTPFRHLAEEWRKVVTRAVDEPFAKVQSQVDSGNFAPSFTSNVLKDSDVNPLSSETLNILKWAASSMYLGGTGTSVSALSTFFLAMVLHPDCQRRAQAEIDEVIGKGRLPRISDKESLPYVNCVINEVLRWQPSTPLVFPHVADRECEVNGMCVPRGAVILVNTWDILQDPSRYTHPEAFMPERYLSPTFEPDPNAYSFGHGRRICPGMDLAQINLFILVSTILAVLDISCAEYADGSLDMPRADYTPGPMRHPKPFRCAMHPRFGVSVDLIKQSASQ